mmetsp:Transcript_106159/g.310324  ORF Transcript_106159/g.310324 Transcript_106159/m.310324 type:complete len:184 (+) Transcript_106159:69-620(+)
MASQELVTLAAIVGLAAVQCLSVENPLAHMAIMSASALTMWLLHVFRRVLISNVARRTACKIQDQGSVCEVAEVRCSWRGLARKTEAACAWAGATARSRTTLHFAGGLAVVVVAGLLRRAGLLGTGQVLLLSLLSGAAAHATLPGEPAGARCACCNSSSCDSTSKCPYSAEFWADLPRPAAEQ